ncbi:MAG: protein kinase [Planctomycetes bacterium]|nr:protein kinase [Planctomycetota bacterium]
MAIGEDNPSPNDPPDLPDIGEAGGVASSAASGREPASDEFSRERLAGDSEEPLLRGDSDAEAPAPDRRAPGTDAHDPYLGKTFGGYQLVEKIGQGGMGVVYKGRQMSLDRVVAVKILNKALYDNQEFIKRFEREAKSIARINHPNIVAVYDFGQSADGLWYMVTELIEGSSLSRMIADKIMIDPKDLAPLMIQCLSGLAHVGQSGIVHRDIKPDNILLTRDVVAKIADFGLAKDVSGTNDHTDLTAAGLAMGTPAYMSPEQCMGRRLDGRSDIYALGVTAYYALAGEKPFVGHSSFEIMTKQREHNPIPPNQLNPRITRECSDLIMRMLAKNPADRFDNAESCRLAWVDLQQRLAKPPGMRSGEFEVPPTTGSTKSNRMKVDLPPAPGSVPPPPLPAQNLSSPPELPSGLPPAPGVPSSSMPPVLGDTGRTRRPPTDGNAPPDVQTGSERHNRPITEKRLRTQADAITCPRCGMLNRAELSSCSKCGNALREVDPSVLARDQEAEAQRLYEQKKFGDAAAIYARLADKEVDRRQRSVLRSKEREMRKFDQEQQVSDVMGRSKAMVERGDLKSAIALLEQTTGKLTSDVTASASGLELSLSRELAILRARIRTKKRTNMIVVLVILVALAIGAFLAKDRIMQLIPGTAASSPATSGTAAPSLPDRRGV